MNHQRTSDWIAIRWGKVTGSRFHDIIAKTKSGYAASRKNYMAELVVERLTEPPTEDVGFKTTAMQDGIDNEPVARLAYELETGNTVDEAFFEQYNDYVGASPDGYVGDKGLIEIKCPKTASHIETLRTQKVPTQYYTQMQGQMLCTGREWCDFISYDPRIVENAQLFIKRVERDESFIADLIDELDDFLDELEEQVEFIKEYNNE
jgi:putative phage-type endonuclease